ncbi:MAG: Gfo/Idh/MocA family oxidoreductase [Dactylosporangium sp.]|nr:Gfo/Idh/MocA family oxidoreductase [Dactylosporangium sp.]NNJ60664.1 Gfo/Idh/MocA family oxidoreductase [Dactylosporangium sp.]
MVGIAQIGFGYWGPNIARNVNALAGDDWRYLVELSLDRRERAAKLYPYLHVTDDLEKVLSDPDVEAVIIATPVATHATLIRQALTAGKHVLVEKPLTASTAAAVELANLAAERGLILMVGHTFEFVPAVRKMRELIGSGAIGDVRYLYSQRLNLGRIQSDINAFWSIGPHDVSIANYLTGSAPRWVSAQGGSYLRPGCEDVTFVTVGYDHGILAHMHVSWLDPMKTRRVTVVGGDKMLVYDDLDTQARLKVFDKGADETQPDASGTWQYRLRDGAIQAPSLDLSEPLAEEIGHYLDCVRDRTRPVTDAWNGVRVVAACEAAERSLRSGGTQVEVSLPTAMRP